MKGIALRFLAAVFAGLIGLNGLAFGQAQCVGDSCEPFFGLPATQEVSTVRISGPVIANNFGVVPLAPVNAITTAALPFAPVYNNNLGQFIASSNGALVIDGVTLSFGNRVLVNNQPAPYQYENGVYIVVATGGASARYQIVRSTDFITSAQIFPGVSTYALAGTVNGCAAYVVTSPYPVVVGQQSITFAQFTAGAGTVCGGSSGSGTVTSITATTPVVVTPSPITTIGDISCPTCLTSAVTSITGTAPIVVTPSPITGIGDISCPTCGIGGGSVLSVTFTGDGVVDSSTPSAPVTTTGTLSATLNTQSAHTALMGPPSGGVHVPTFRIPVCADLSDAGVGCPAGLISSSAFGIGKVDGTTLTASGGVLTAATATASTLGIVEPDDTTITIAAGVLSAVPGGGGSTCIVNVANETVFCGFEAGQGSTTTDTVAIGTAAGINTAGTTNVFIGDDAGGGNVLGGDVIAIGDAAGAGGYTGFGEAISIGDGAGNNNTVCVNAIGQHCLDIIGIGDGSGSNNQYVSNLVAIGNGAGSGIILPSNSSGNGIVAIGVGAGGGTTVDNAIYIEVGSANPFIDIGGTYKAAAGVATIAAPVADLISQSAQVATATLTATSNTTLATVTGLSQALTAVGNYSCHGHLTGVSGATGGIKAALVASGGLTATSATFTGFTWNGTTAVASNTVTALGSNLVAAAAIYSDIYIDGSILVNHAGTINVQAAQDASDGTSTTVLLGSTFGCQRVS